MLVISRMMNEAAVIVLEDGREIGVMNVEMRGFAVRLGFNAPRSIQIHRLEVWNKIKNQSFTPAGDPSNPHAAPAGALNNESIMQALIAIRDLMVEVGSSQVQSSASGQFFMPQVKASTYVEASKGFLAILESCSSKGAAA